MPKQAFAAREALLELKQLLEEATKTHACRRTRSISSGSGRRRVQRSPIDPRKNRGSAAVAGFRRETIAGTREAGNRPFSLYHGAGLLTGSRGVPPHPHVWKFTVNFPYTGYDASRNQPKAIPCSR